MEDTVKSLKDNLPYITSKKYINKTIEGFEPRFYDTREYFKSLTKYPEPVTIKNMEKHLASKGRVTTIDHDNIKNVVGLSFVGLVVYGGEYDCICVSDKVKFYKSTNRFVFSNYDFFFNIRVYGATYSYLWCGDGCDIQKDEEIKKLGRRFDMEKTINGTTTVHLFSDVTYDNPLHRSQSGCRLEIFTDGDRMTYCGGMMELECRHVFSLINDTWMVNELQSRILLNGHIRAPGLSFPVGDIVEVEKPTPEEIAKKESVVWLPLP